MPTRRGHTILELLVVVAIIAVIAAVAIPSYEAYSQKGRRENLKALMLSLAAAEERFFTAHGYYSTELERLAPFEAPTGTAVSDGYQIGEHRVTLINHIRQATGHAFVIVGRTNIDRTADSLEDCWYFFSRNMSLPFDTQGGLVWGYDDVSNQVKTNVPELPPSQVCTMEQ
mgnify:CR=1 FL=1